MKAVVKCTSAAVKNWISWCPCAGIIHLKSPIGSYFALSAFYKAHFRIIGYRNPILSIFLPDILSLAILFGPALVKSYIVGISSARHNTCLNSVPFTRQRTTKPEIFNQILVESFPALAGLERGSFSQMSRHVPTTLSEFVDRFDTQRNFANSAPV